MKKPVYLDYNASTPIAPEVRDAMKPYLDEYFGNPSSAYSYGAATRTAVENARKQIAALLGCHTHEIIFTSGGTESNNMAIKGIAFARKDRGRHIITSSIEHPAVSEVCKYLEENGFEITYLPVDKYGMVSTPDVEKAIRPGTILISIMHANNEIGTLQPIKEIAEIAHHHGIVMHTDAAQSTGKVPVNDLGADLISVAGHKLHAPKGIGVLYIREGIKLEKLIHGADHEQNLRAGTENVLEIVGLGKACEIASRDLEQNISHSRNLRDLLFTELTSAIPDLQLNGHPELRLPNTLNVTFPGIEAAALLSEIQDEVAASAGAACHTGDETYSPTLKAIGLDAQQASATVRFSVGRYLSEDDIRKAAAVIVKAYNRFKGGEEISQVSPGSLKLTSFTQGLGCACKLRPQALQEVMRSVKFRPEANILVAHDTMDDAAVYKISEDKAIVQTLDFFTPVVDNAYDFGAIAAANALSDIYAMGAKPLFALNIAAFPSTRLPMSVLADILKGASDKAGEAGIQVIGGHTVDDNEPKFGMAVTGIIHPDKILRNSNSKAGDVFILTKAIGTGILATALKRGLLDENTSSVLVKSMSELNKQAAEIMAGFPVNACTDITGFGLLGHTHEMLESSGCDAELYLADVPLLPQVSELASAGIIPGGSKNNEEFFSQHMIWDEDISSLKKLILNDAQTSGGLLISIPEKYAAELVSELRKSIPIAAIIAKNTGKGSGKIHIRK